MSSEAGAPPLLGGLAARRTFFVGHTRVRMRRDSMSLWLNTAGPLGLDTSELRMHSWSPTLRVDRREPELTG